VYFFVCGKEESENVVNVTNEEVTNSLTWVSMTCAFLCVF
jgi:hypothetical protein